VDHAGSTAATPSGPGPSADLDPPRQTSGAAAEAGSARRRRTAVVVVLAGLALVVAVTAHVVDITARGPEREVLLVEDFTGSDGPFVSSSAFWNGEDLGEAENATWLSESGALLRRSQQGSIDGDVFRMWTRERQFAFSQVDLDVRFDGWTGGGEDWHGINLWLNASLCVPLPDCGKIDDLAGGEGGYALEFMNRDGTASILKKVPGDSRDRWPSGAVEQTQGGTYYELATGRFQPEPGRSYRFTASVQNHRGDGAALQVLVDGQTVLEVVDDGAVGGPPLKGQRVGVRGDYVRATFDELEISRVE
jgi:hypothetical protein